MKRIQVLRRTTPVSDIDMYENDDHYQKDHRGDRARLRRWRQIKHQIA